MDSQYPELSLEERVARLEGALGWGAADVPLRREYFLAAAPLLLVALALGYLGMGLPNHYYQLVFAVLSVALLYHRGWLAIPKRAYQWLLAGLNTLVLAIVFKLLIGSGKAQPLAWVKLPHITGGVAEKEGFLDKMVPSWSLTWEPSPLAEWMIDLTILQTFLLLVTLIGALFSFQPFASLTAFLLVLVSIPALATFNWTWVVPALVAAALAFYVQTADTNRAE